MSVSISTLRAADWFLQSSNSSCTYYYTSRKQMSLKTPKDMATWHRCNFVIYSDCDW